MNSFIFENRLRRIFWPIHRSELGKFVPIAALMFCILFNQNILRILKDSILISEISAEASSFAKVYCVTPCAAIFVVIYAKLINHLSLARIYYYIVCVFVGFCVIFAFILYPNTDFFHADTKTVHDLMELHPHLKWYIAIAGNWSYIIFYTLAELWPNIFYVLLFWQLANEITTTEEAKRFYTLFSLFGNSSLIFVGLLMMHLSSDESIATRYFANIATTNKTSLVQASVLCVVIFAAISCWLVHFIANNIMTNPIFYARAKQPASTKDKMGIVQSFKYIGRSKYLWLMLICSAAFGLSMNLVEAVWKAKIKELYPTVNSYAEFNSLYILWTGVAIMVMTIIGNNVMRSHNWFVAAVISPIIIMVTGTMFFILAVFDQQIVDILDGIILMSPLALAVSIGAVQNILAKGAKYSIWDTSKEMLYIPLDDQLRTKGKAAVDVISSKVGKSSSGLIQALIFTIFPAATLSSISSLLMVIFIIVCIFWIHAVRKIYFEYLNIV